MQPLFVFVSIITCFQICNATPTNYTCPNTSCVIDCSQQDYCNNYNIFCPNDGECLINAPQKSSTFSDLTIYCGDFGNCTISGKYCNDASLTIHANHSQSVKVYIAGGDFTSNYDINIYATNLYSLEYDINLIPLSSEPQHHYINAPNITELYITCQDGSLCQNMIINAFHADNITFEDLNPQNDDFNLYINASNSNNVQLTCSTFAAFVQCRDIYLFCGSNCNVYGSYYDLSLHVSQLLNATFLLLTNSNISTDNNYAEELDIVCHSCSKNIFSAINAQSFKYYVNTQDVSNQFFLSNVTNIIYSTSGFNINSQESKIHAEYAHNIDIECIAPCTNPNDPNCPKLCVDMNIYAQYATNLRLICNNELGNTACYFMNIYANNTYNVSIEANSGNAFVNSNLYGINITNINITCINQGPSGASCPNSKFNVSNVDNINFECIGMYSCSSSIVINAEYAKNIYFYGTGNNVSGDGFILDGRYSDNMTVFIDGKNETSPQLNGMQIYASSNYSTSIYCYGVNSCGTLQLYSIHGISDINMIFTPNCSNCANATNITTNNSYNTECFDYECMECADITLYCNDDYRDVSSFGNEYNSNNNALCNGVCCHHSIFYEECIDDNHSKKSLYYYVSVVIGFLILIAVFYGLYKLFRKFTSLCANKKQKSENANLINDVIQ